MQNVMLIGPRDTGKTFLLAPLENIYKTFSSPPKDKFGWADILDNEVIFLNDFRWSKDVISWDDLLRLFACESVTFARPKNQYKTNAILTPNNSIPIFATGMDKITYKGPYNLTDKLEDAQMNIRIKYFEFFNQVPENKVKRQVKPCARCFSEFILSTIPDA